MTMIVMMIMTATASKNDDNSRFMTKKKIKIAGVTDIIFEGAS